jgi:DNA-binding NtrC family response regulator
MISTSHHSNSKTEPGKSADRHRILIIDDEPAILFAYRKLIEKEGMCVDISTCLDGALKQIKKHHYLAVVADVRLAGSDNEDGLVFLKILRIKQPTTKMILATGYGSSEIEKSARSLGVSHYFEKPVQPAEIMGALRSFSDEFKHFSENGNSPKIRVEQFDSVSDIPD